MKNRGEYKILIVDDEQKTLDTFVALFDEDFSLLTASSGKEALKLLRENPDTAVAIVDQRMPEMTGLELMLKIKKDYPDTVRVLFTGYSDADVLQSIVNQADIYKYIRKPYEDGSVKEILNQSIEKYLDEKEKKKQLNHTFKLIQQQTAHAMENYTAWISHHLNNGMQIIQTFVDVAQKKFEADPSEKDFAKSAKDYMKRVTAIFQTLHQIYAEGVRQFVKVPLNTLIKFEDTDIRELIKKKNIVLKINLSGEDMEIMANPMAVQEALRRLVVNAVEASSNGGSVEVSVSKFFDDGQDAVMFQVRDFGKGISSEIKDKLFYPFLQLGSNVTNPKGLGLPFVQAVVARHGGDIMVESKVGAGTTITFTLPIIQEEQGPVDPLEQKAMELLKRKTLYCFPYMLYLIGIPNDLF